MKLFNKGFVIILLATGLIVMVMTSGVVSTYVQENMVWKIKGEAE